MRVLGPQWRNGVVSKGVGGVVKSHETRRFQDPRPPHSHNFFLNTGI